jgi:hypothetical protein
MQIGQCIGCVDFPCQDVKHSRYIVPEIDIDPRKFTIVLISEAAPAESSDYYYAPGKPLFEETTVLAFNDAGAEISSVDDILDMGVYMTTAVKCGKVGYGLKAATIKECSKILEEELDLFPNINVLLLMGDVAIRALNYIAKRKGIERVIPAGATYKIRGEPYFYGSIRTIPSYLQAGPSFFIEKSKRRMISEDIKAALQV